MTDIAVFHKDEFPAIATTPGVYCYAEWGVFIDVDNRRTVPDGKPVVTTRWCSGGRMMSLVGNVAFLDPDGLVWVAWDGMCFNGRSMPRSLWVLVSPYTGRGRDAAVFHDSGCITKDRPDWEVHRMFYRALRARGVHPMLAWWEWFGVTLGCHFNARGENGTALDLAPRCPCPDLRKKLGLE